MSLHFFDTSALFKHYHRETGFERVDALFDDSDGIFISELAFVEFASVLHRLKNRGEIGQTRLDHVLARFNLDTTDRIVVVGLRHESIQQAQQLVLNNGLRTLDALQLASALTLKPLGLVFVCADFRLLQAAQANGLEILNPLTA